MYSLFVTSHIRWFSVTRTNSCFCRYDIYTWGQ